ncbi:MAG: hypothetical protein COB29_11410 [Sulfitobacter sp.]|nr:hypothetical protein [Roseobacter sp.]MBV47677.1 hypothetical protein [Roseobacter sp.]PHR05786.1 MAG: hypothetical protein COB29_11410 [Sulfitobacter sp.]
MLTKTTAGPGAGFLTVTRLSAKGHPMLTTRQRDWTERPSRAMRNRADGHVATTTTLHERVA